MFPANFAAPSEIGVRVFAKSALFKIPTVTNTVSKQTKYLVDEEGKTSSKRTKAIQLNIEIVTIEEIVNNE